MALNIKNERTVALARELAQLQGSTVTSAIERALEAQLAHVHSQGHHLDHRATVKLRQGRELAEQVYASMTDADRAALRTAQDALYDGAGLPQ